MRGAADGGEIDRGHIGGIEHGGSFQRPEDSTSQIECGEGGQFD